MRFKKGQLTKEAFDVIMHDLACIEITHNEDNIYHLNLVIGNLKDIFGVKDGTDTVSD